MSRKTDLIKRSIRYVISGLTLGLAILENGYAQNINANTPWIWMGGDTTLSQQGVYGTKGVAAPNNRPAARSQAASWTDSLGNFWLFGGRSYGGSMTEAVRNDLWKFSPFSKLWTWVGGDSTTGGVAVTGQPTIPSVNNIPSARSMPNHWKDNNGCFWVMGGVINAGAASRRNDLWKFNPYTTEWTLMRGNPNTLDTPGIYGTLGVTNATNIPGSRGLGATWTDNNGDLWLFGGQGRASTTTDVTGLSDWWKYNIPTNQWTWMGGPSISSPAANYGTQGVMAASNIPGGRLLPVHWKDTAGNFWMMGGSGYVTTTQGLLNDVWKFDPLANQWVWIQGTNVINDAGLYISRGVASADRRPKSRRVSTTWVDLDGGLWLFGGSTNSFQTNVMNDIWKFDIGANQWTWVKGDSIPNIQPRYNTLGVPGNNNEVGSRAVEISWREKKSNNVWVFGGHIPTYSTRNDLWKIESCSPIAILPPITGPDTVCAGATVVYNAPIISGAFTYLWDTPAGWTSTPNNQQITLVAGNANGTISVRVLGTCGDTSNVQIRNIVVEAQPVPVINQTGAGAQVTLSVAGTYTSYQWYLNGVPVNGATSSTYQATVNGDYTVQVTSPRGCAGMSQVVNVSGITAVNTLEAAAGIAFYPNPVHKMLSIQCFIPAVLRIISMEGKLLQTYRLNPGKNTVTIDDFVSGTYFAEFRTPDGAFIHTSKINKN